MCSFGGGVGVRKGQFVFYELLGLRFVYLLIIYVFIGFYLCLFWIFVLVFSGLVVRLVSAERKEGAAGGCGGGVLEIEARRREGAKRMFLFFPKE